MNHTEKLLSTLTSSLNLFYQIWQLFYHHRFRPVEALVTISKALGKKAIIWSQSPRCSQFFYSSNHQTFLKPVSFSGRQPLIENAIHGKEKSRTRFLRRQGILDFFVVLIKTKWRLLNFSVFKSFPYLRFLKRTSLIRTNVL